jgi:WD40 repeat protein
MEAEKPVQPADAPQPVPWWSGRRACAVLILLFAVIFVGSWWLTPIEPYATLNLDNECFFSSLFSPDGTMLVTSGGRNGPLRVWDVERGQERFSFAYDWKAIETVLFSPDSGLLVAHDWEGEFKLWNPRTGEEVASIRPVGGGKGWVPSVNFRFSPDGRFLVFQDFSKGAGGDYITFWNIQSKRAQGSVESSIQTLAFAPDGQSFATYRQHHRVKINEVRLWKIDQVPMLVMKHQITATAVEFSPDLQTFATAGDLPDGNGQISMWDNLTGEKLWSVKLNEHGTHWHSLSFIANGKVLSADGSNGDASARRWRTTLWDVTSTPKEIGSYSEREPSVIASDGEWLAIPLDSGAKLIKLSPPQRGDDLVVKSDLVRRVYGRGAFGMQLWPTPTFSPDSKLMLVRGLWRGVKKPYLGDWLPKKYNPFRADPGGAIVRVWDTETRREVFSFDDCSNGWFSPDSRVLATLREDRTTIDLWTIPFRASLWRILGSAMIGWLIVVSVGWVGVKIQRKMFSRTNAPLPRPESSDGKQSPDPKKPPLSHEPPPQASG